MIIKLNFNCLSQIHKFNKRLHVLHLMFLLCYPYQTLMFKKQILTFSPTLMSKFFAYCMSTSTLIWIFFLIHAIKTTRHHRLASIMNKLASLFPLWYLMIDTVSYHVYKKIIMSVN